MRVTALHVLPSDEVLMTMSLELHPERKRQSDHATKTLPAPSIADDGKFGSRRPPATKWLVMVAIARVRTPVLHASVERNTSMPPPSKATTTVPLGCTTGSPPSPPA